MIDWYEIGKAERQLISDVIDFENEMTRIDRTTYNDKSEHYLLTAQNLREAIQRYGSIVNKAQQELVG